MGEGKNCGRLATCPDDLEGGQGRNSDRQVLGEQRLALAQELLGAVLGAAIEQSLDLLDHVRKRHQGIGRDDNLFLVVGQKEAQPKVWTITQPLAADLVLRLVPAVKEQLVVHEKSLEHLEVAVGHFVTEQSQGFSTMNLASSFQEFRRRLGTEVPPAPLQGDVLCANGLAQFANKPPWYTAANRDVRSR